ncbi:hypothetical protein TTHERM_000787009 (macronuclear) [Tetrahymena thermophila SB210]|uniref:Uncharacterized protein n=1 Tax=Tetrahymena thermophila (strain SB210) TaxID=312017 RepID=W7XFK9_TETTS|nr:hypothetical protein TTHERM_000787009 [Tetrahymena thermophila SB210]EWS72786.1 hypothetical protein TTHERM_000787009 [Tetrahymena thermophila SB210]|eukprot:XP_012654673.1 hypothetical protein TTHERM_000787009 [Tetrahymena thermophila SB210]
MLDMLQYILSQQNSQQQREQRQSILYPKKIEREVFTSADLFENSSKTFQQQQKNEKRHQTAITTVAIKVLWIQITLQSKSNETYLTREYFHLDRKINQLRLHRALQLFGISILTAKNTNQYPYKVKRCEQCQKLNTGIIAQVMKYNQGYNKKLFNCNQQVKHFIGFAIQQPDMHEYLLKTIAWNFKVTICWILSIVNSL